MTAEKVEEENKHSELHADVVFSVEVTKDQKQATAATHQQNR